MVSIFCWYFCWYFLNISSSQNFLHWSWLDSIYCIKASNTTMNQNKTSILMLKISPFLFFPPPESGSKFVCDFRFRCKRCKYGITRGLHLNTRKNNRNYFSKLNSHTKNKTPNHRVLCLTKHTKTKCLIKIHTFNKSIRILYT